MQFKVGEKVRFLHEPLEGVVTRILGKGMLEVIVDDFEDYEVHEKDLVKIDAAESRYIRRDEPEEPVVLPDTPQLPPSLVVSLNPEKGYEFWVLNESRSELLFSLSIRLRKKFRSINAGVIPPGEHRLAGHISKADFNMSAKLHIACIWHPLDDAASIPEPLSLDFSTRTEIMGQKPQWLQDVKKDGFRFILKKPELKENLLSETPKTQALKKQAPDVPEIVDLHIEKIIDNPMGLSSDAMLQFQLEHFEQTLSQAAFSGKKRIVFIHGIGNGILKKEIHQRLKGNNFVTDYNLADPVVYGNGATEVNLVGK